MNVGELKKRLEGISDDTLLVLEGRDHSYRYASVIEAQAEAHFDGRKLPVYLAEYHGRGWEGDPPGKVIDVLLFY